MTEPNGVTLEDVARCFDLSFPQEAALVRAAARVVSAAVAVQIVLEAGCKPRRVKNALAEALDAYNRLKGGA